MSKRRDTSSSEVSSTTSSEDKGSSISTEEEVNVKGEDKIKDSESITEEEESAEVLDLENQPLEELDTDEESTPQVKPKTKTYGDRCRLYWYQFINPNVWTSMPVFVVIGIAFWCLRFIPDYEKCMLSQSIFAIIGGVILGAIPPIRNLINHHRVHDGVAFSKQMFMRLAVILYGFKVKLDDIGSVGWGGAIPSILMVIITFLFGMGIGTLFKIPLGSKGTISCGYSICGIAAILACGPIFQANSEEISLACVFVIVGGFLDIIIYPSLYSIKEKLDWNDKNFGISAGISIKEIAHTVSVGLSCSAEVSTYAMIVKMFKVLLLPFLLIALAFIMPAIAKCQERKGASRKHSDSGTDLDDDINEEERTTSEKCQEFWGKVTIPYFALLFILMTIINSYVDIGEKAHEVFNEIIICALSTSMFCVGITTDLRTLYKTTSIFQIVYIIIMYIWVFGFGWLLEYVFRRI